MRVHTGVGHEALHVAALAPVGMRFIEVYMVYAAPGGFGQEVFLQGIAHLVELGLHIAIGAGPKHGGIFVGDGREERHQGRLQRLIAGNAVEVGVLGIVPLQRVDLLVDLSHELRNLVGVTQYARLVAAHGFVVGPLVDLPHAHEALLDGNRGLDILTMRQYGQRQVGVVVDVLLPLQAL